MLQTSTSTPYLTAAGLGVVAGMRSMAAPAALAAALHDAPGARLAPAPARQLAHPLADRALRVMAAGEVVADKLPGMPDRVAPQVLAGRLATGALAGAAVFALHGERRLMGALVGAAAAFVATHLFFRLRTGASARLPVPDAVVALVEDTLVVSGGRALARAAVR